MSGSDQDFVVRPTEAGDVEALQVLFEASSPDSCARLVADGRWGAALVAVATDGQVIGVARFDREGGAGREADAAVFVAEPWRNRGIGRLLVAELVGLAASRGMHVTTTTLLGDAA
jgi:GNAT superfamily N-acetyltransferase